MHKNFCHQSFSFWLRYAPDHLSAGASPQTSLGELTVLPRPPSWFRGWGPGEREGGRGKGGRGGEVRGGSPGMSKSIIGKPKCAPFRKLSYSGKIRNDTQSFRSAVLFGKLYQPGWQVDRKGIFCWCEMFTAQNPAYKTVLWETCWGRTPTLTVIAAI